MLLWSLPGVSLAAALRILQVAEAGIAASLQACNGNGFGTPNREPQEYGRNWTAAGIFPFYMHIYVNIYIYICIHGCYTLRVLILAPSRVDFL